MKEEDEEWKHNRLSSPNTHELQVKQKPGHSQGSDEQAGACSATKAKQACSLCHCQVFGQLRLFLSHSLPDPSANNSTLPSAALKLRMWGQTPPCSRTGAADVSSVQINADGIKSCTRKAGEQWLESSLQPQTMGARSLPHQNEPRWRCGGQLPNPSRGVPALEYC